MLSIKNLPKLPEGSGVYFFLGPPKLGEGGKHKCEILYIGKATSLRDRVRSYFSRDLLTTRGPRLPRVIELATRLDFQPTDSVLEALLLEAELIRRYQPKYNIEAKDDKSFNYVVITDEEIPRVLTKRGRGLAHDPLQPTIYNLNSVFGPFPHGAELKAAMKIVRRLFPYHDRGPIGKLCFDYQVGLCPGVCGGLVSPSEYRRTLKHIKLFFRGRKKQLVKLLEREMKRMAKTGAFEEAAKLRDKIFALNHIQDVSLLKRQPILSTTLEPFRIEAYDIAHTSGRETVGVMTVVEDGEKATGEYRMFKLRGQASERSDDTANLAEIIKRRLNHFEWRKPNLIVVDGGRAQLNAARRVLAASGWAAVTLVAVVKDERHRPRAVLNLPRSLRQWQDAVLLANNESHRFALAYHRARRGKIV